MSTIFKAFKSAVLPETVPPAKTGSYVMDAFAFSAAGGALSTALGATSVAPGLAVPVALAFAFVTARSLTRGALSTIRNWTGHTKPPRLDHH